MIDVTIIITCSEIPEHPTTKFIESAITSLERINARNNPIILAHDAGTGNSSYDQYIKLVKDIYESDHNIKVCKTPSKTHLTGNIRNAIKFVNTTYVLIMQHDLPFIGTFDINLVAEDMKTSNDVKFVIFNKRANTCIGDDAITKYNNLDLFGDQVELKNYKYTRTPRWSDNNHLCRTDYYRDIILQEVPDHKPMEFDIFYDGLKVQYSHNKDSLTKQLHEKYGMYLFGELNKPATIFHTNAYPKRPPGDDEGWDNYIQILNEIT